MRSQAVLVMMVAAVMVVSSKGLAAKAPIKAAAKVAASMAQTIECEGSDMSYMCMGLPAEALETSSNEQAPIQESMKLAMASSADLSGEAADFTVIADSGIPTATYIALPSSNNALGRLKYVETFLRASPITRDGLVVVTGH